MPCETKEAEIFVLGDLHATKSCSLLWHTPYPSCIRRVLLDQAKGLSSPASCSHSSQPDAHGNSAIWTWAEQHPSHLWFPAMHAETYCLWQWRKNVAIDSPSSMNLCNPLLMPLKWPSQPLVGVNFLFLFEVRRPELYPIFQEQLHHRFL